MTSLPLIRPFAHGSKPRYLHLANTFELPNWVKRSKEAIINGIINSSKLVDQHGHKDQEKVKEEITWVILRWERGNGINQRREIEPRCQIRYV